jgi:hypothetical protein
MKTLVLLHAMLGLRPVEFRERNFPAQPMLLKAL